MPKKANSSQTRSFKTSPFVTLMKEVHQHADLRRHLIRKLEALYDAKVITFFTSFKRQNVQITDDDVEMLESVLASEGVTGNRLLLIISSPGGQALAAEHIVNVCRAYSNGRFEVLVPHMAKSAATMICFGATKIHMSKTAELGPVDPQVPYWSGKQDEDTEPEWISAEEYLRSYDQLIDTAGSGKAKRMEPYLQQLSRYDARFIEKLRSIQRLSEDISVRLLKSSMMNGQSIRNIRKHIDVFLTQKRMSSHGRMIGYSEAKACGLKIELVDLQSDKWSVAWELYVRSDWSVNKQYGKIIETSQSAVQA